MNCDKCAYKGICKFEDDARKFEEVINSFADKNEEILKPDCLEILIKCSKFKMKYETVFRKGLDA